jgi:hypothetical protein
MKKKWTRIRKMSVRGFAFASVFNVNLNELFNGQSNGHSKQKIF